MAVPGPPTSLAQARAEFGAPVGTPLHDLYRGGPWVPNIPQNASVPASPPVRLAQLAGAVKYVAPVISGPHNLTIPANTSSASGTWSASGGTGSYSYNWTKTSNTGATVSINNATIPNPTFSRTLLNTEGDSFWNLAVNDGVTTVNYSVEVFAASTN